MLNYTPVDFLNEFNKENKSQVTQVQDENDEFDFVVYNTLNNPIGRNS